MRLDTANETKNKNSTAVALSPDKYYYPYELCIKVDDLKESYKVIINIEREKRKEMYWRLNQIINITT